MHGHRHQYTHKQRTCGAYYKVDAKGGWDKRQQQLGLPVRHLSLEPRMKLPNVGLQCDATQPPIERHCMAAEGRRAVSQYDEEGDRDPARKGMPRIVLQLG